MRKISAFILLICLFFTVLGYHFIFQYQIRVAKTSMKKTLRNTRNREDLIEFTFTTNQPPDLEWKNDHEFKFRGSMYDVVDIHEDKDQVHIRCISDEKETALIEQYFKINKGKDQSAPVLSMLRMTATPFILQSLQLPSIPQNIFSFQYPVFSSGIEPGIHKILLPPPRVC